MVLAYLKDYIMQVYFSNAGNLNNILLDVKY